jgi:hypothetical protein
VYIHSSRSSATWNSGWTLLSLIQKLQNTEWRHSQIKPFSLLFSGDRVKYVGASVVVEADNRYLLKAMLSSFWFCGPHLFWNPFHYHSLDLTILHIICYPFCLLNKADYNDSSTWSMALEINFVCYNNVSLHDIKNFHLIGISTWYKKFPSDRHFNVWALFMW